MEHSFDIAIAQEYGMECAVIIKHLYFWIKKNQVCEKNFHDGRYWTYGSVKAFCELFPYMGDKKLRNAFKRLEDNGLIVVGNYNTLPFDRTNRLEQDAYDKNINFSVPRSLISVLLGTRLW